MRGKRGIYLDHQATTPLDPRVLEAMLPFLTEDFGNAASRAHPYGWAADEAVKRAREQVAGAIGASAQELIWTSGATESSNLALQGVAAAYAEHGRHFISCGTEHPATRDTLQHLAAQGAQVTWLPVDAAGRLDPAAVAAALRPDTVLVSLMHANNEIGVVHDIAAVGRLAKDRGVLFHVDAAQTLGKLPIDVQAQGIDLLSLSAHKVYGPKGVGALYVRRRDPRVRLAPQIFGGGHERGWRSGTLNVASIVGMGEAVALAMHRMDADAARLTALRDRLLAGLRAAVPDLQVNGALEPRLPGNLNVAFPGLDGGALIGELRGLAVSSGSACASASPEPSHVLLALGLSRELARASLRFGAGRGTTEVDIDEAVAIVAAAVGKLRAGTTRARE